MDRRRWPAPENVPTGRERPQPQGLRELTCPAALRRLPQAIAQTLLIPESPVAWLVAQPVAWRAVSRWGGQSLGQLQWVDSTTIHSRGQRLFERRRAALAVRLACCRRWQAMSHCRCRWRRVWRKRQATLAVLPQRREMKTLLTRRVRRGCCW